MEKICGIYLIRNLVNGKVYIGQSINIQKRFHIHLLTLRARTHNNEHLLRAFEKYGEEALPLEIVEICKRNALNKLERKYVKKFDSMNPEKGYNLEGGGRKGKKMSDETRRKMSESRKGKPLSAEHRKHCSESKKGKKFTPEHCENIRKSKTGKNNARYGKHHSEETKRRMSETRKRIFTTPEGERLRMIASNTHKGKTVNETVNMKG